MRLNFYQFLAILVMVLGFASPGSAQAPFTQLGLGSPGRINQISDSEFVMFTTDGKLVSTHDRWVSWESYQFESEFYLTDMLFVGRKGMILGDRYYYLTSDAGNSWKKTRYPSFGVFDDLVGLPDGSFHWIDSKGYLYSSVDGALPHRANDTIIFQTLRSTTDGYLIGTDHDKRFFESIDGGSTWNPLAGFPRAYAYAFTDRKHAIADVAASPKNYGLITSDGGASWDTLPGSTGMIWQLDSTTFRFGNVIYSTIDGKLDSVASGISYPSYPEILSGGVIYRTTKYELRTSSDTGRTWQTRFSLRTPYSYGLMHYGPGRMKAQYGGNLDDYMYRSTDSGYTWAQEGKDLGTATISRWFDDSVGYIAYYDLVLYTRDAGKTTKIVLGSWTPGYGPVLSGSMQRNDTVVHVFRDGTYYRLVGDTAIVTKPFPYRSMNGADARGKILALTAYDANTQAWFVISRDGGDTWGASKLEFGGQIKIVDDKTIFRRSSQGWFVTTDDGATWDAQPMPRNGGDAIFISRDSIAYVNDSIFTTVDGGKTWRKWSRYIGSSFNMSVSHGLVYFPSTYFMQRVSIADLFGAEPPKPPRPNTLRWVLGSGSDLGVAQAPKGDLVKWSETATYRLMRSTDLGKTWTRSDSNAPQRIGRLYTAGNEMYTYDGYRSSTQGRTWKATGLQWIPTIQAIEYAKNGYVFAAESKGMSFSRDKGLTWQYKDTVLKKLSIYGLKAHPLTGDLYAATDEGIMRSLDNGATWSAFKKRSPADQRSHIITFTPTGKIYAAQEGTLIASTDEGNTWYELPPAGFAAALVAVNDSMLCGLFGSSDSYFRYTTDEGLHWIECDTLRSGPNQPEKMKDLRMLKSGHLVVAGETHGISRTISPIGEGQSSVDVEEPNEVSADNANCLKLSPNPASTSITIGGECARYGSVTIYNSAGAKCQESYWRQGEQIDVSSLLPGVYYLQLGSESTRFVITR